MGHGSLRPRTFVLFLSLFGKSAHFGNTFVYMYVLSLALYKWLKECDV